MKIKLSKRITHANRNEMIKKIPFTFERIVERRQSSHTSIRRVAAVWYVE